MTAKKKDPPAPPSDIVSIVVNNGALAALVKTPKERAAIVLRASEREVELAELVKKSADITEVKNADGRAQVHRMAMDLKNTRCEIENDAKDARDDSNKFSKAVIEVQDELVAIIKDEETRVFKLRDEFDEKVAAEKAEAERVEGERKAALAAKVEAIRAIPVDLVSADSTAIRAALTDLAERELTKEEFAEQIDAANLAMEVTGQKLMSMLADAEDREEAEAERVAAADKAARQVAAQAEANKVAAAVIAAQQADLARRVHEFNERQAEVARREEASKVIEPEAVQSSIAAADAQPEQVAPAIIDIAPDGGMFIFRAEPEAANETTGLQALVEAIPEELELIVGSLRQAVKHLTEAGIGPDGIRAIVESELVA